jgi:uncharacterized protein YecE (DUF72 family)
LDVVGFPSACKSISKFCLVELQSTFYRVPKLETVAGWRMRAREDFEFSVKAWQAITHPLTSPTWKRAKIKVDVENRDNLRIF